MNPEDVQVNFARDPYFNEHFSLFGCVSFLKIQIFDSEQLFLFPTNQIICHTRPCFRKKKQTGHIPPCKILEEKVSEKKKKKKKTPMLVLSSTSLVSQPNFTKKQIQHRILQRS